MAVLHDAWHEVIRKAAVVLDPFVTNEFIEYCLRVKISDGNVISSPAGLQTEGRFTEVSISSSAWTALPATPLTDRNHISMQNLSGIEMKINFDDGVGYEGIVLADGNERHYDIKDDIIIYARAASGTPVLYVEELA